MNQRPNILFAIADDASHMGAYGHKFVNTPNFDRIAEEGILFQNAFTTNPKCAPSRASILSGMHTWQMEEACNHYGIFPSKFKVYPDLLEDAGYHIGYTGKGWAPGDWEAGGFARNPAGPVYNQHKLVPPTEGISDIDYASNFNAFLEERQQNQPFCFWFGCLEPHRKYEEGSGVRAGKNLDEIKLPSYYPDDEIIKSDWLDYALEIDWFDLQLGKILNTLEELGELEHTLIVVTSDNGMPFPRIKGQMYEHDLRLPMALYWKNQVPGGRKIEDLISFIDLAPTFVEAAGLPPHAQFAGRSLMNMIRSDQQGRVEADRNKVYMGKERHDVGTENDVAYPVRCIRTEKYLYVRNFKPDLWPAGNPETGYTNVDSSPTKTLLLKQHAEGQDDYYHLSFGKRAEEELFEIRTDPECITNLAEDPHFDPVKKELWLELKKVLVQTGDPRTQGRGDVFDHYEYVGDQSHSWKAYKEGWFCKQKF
ncbi:sulfatase [Paenibacillus sp. F411]|uniref:sulfatase family protein n=1 Tax=Paenibacillus sp. F411 TaxID=2820239 RepID=UPI001AAE2B85|nr:sulfatase [Paenibacillus sp. F411]MBO2945247.1 sulfatase [Paenibacillus sp. F411]